MATALAVDVAFYGRVFMRRVAFLAAGDVLPGHDHGRDHMSLVTRGRVRVVCPMLGTDRVLGAGDHIEVPARSRHELTALEPDSESWCIFAVTHPSEAA